MQWSTVLFSALVALGAAGCAGSSFAVRPTSTPTAADETPGRVLVVVRVPVPWYAPRFVVRGKFEKVLPEYEGIAPLVTKLFTISDDSRFGGIYLWSTREAAEAHFDARWRDNVRAKRGVDADVLLVDAPFVVEGRAILAGTPIGTRSTRYPASVSMVRWGFPPTTDSRAAARALAELPIDEALVRRFVVTSTNDVGLVELWADRESAERATTASRRASVAGAIGAGASSYTLFEAPLLLDQRLRDEDHR